ncbi:MAG: N-acetylmuramic acid 6-phosphate etherase [Elusimicrobiaceae bacterium]|nr:N-acetylmuramic acid 6-phosphate etherase [Elusimicrobiaceae bacterium]
MSMTKTLPTEQINPHTQKLDVLTPMQLARVINAEDFNAARAVKKAHKEIAATLVLAAQTHAAKHKIIFIGAGTSGRLGILEAVECVPTFGTRPRQIIGLIAGGKKAVFRSQEGAEDNAQQGARDIAAQAQANDLVIGLTASGRTPYVLGALIKAKQLGAHTVLLSCNRQADTSHADIHIYLPTGPEALSGSTRMKAGTATKMALNAITTGAMALCGKTYGNLMVDVQPTNKKLVARAIRLICLIAHTDEKTAAKLLKNSGQHVKTAIVMHRKQVSRAQAKRLLQKRKGFLKDVLDD